MRQAARVRLRPILMTTLCTLFGLLPLALGLGAGSEMQKPLALAVIGGLALSTPITLFLVPTLLVAIRGRELQARRRQRRETRRAAARALAAMTRGGARAGDRCDSHGGGRVRAPSFALHALGSPWTIGGCRTRGRRQADRERDPRARVQGDNPPSHTASMFNWLGDPGTVVGGVVLLRRGPDRTLRASPISGCTEPRRSS